MAQTFQTYLLTPRAPRFDEITDKTFLDYIFTPRVPRLLWTDWAQIARVSQAGV